MREADFRERESLGGTVSHDPLDSCTASRRKTAVSHAIIISIVVSILLGVIELRKYGTAMGTGFSSGMWLLKSSTTQGIRLGLLRPGLLLLPPFTIL